MKHEYEVVVIYVPSDGNMHAFAAARVNGEWRYSKPAVLEASYLNPFIKEFLEDGWSVMDVRTLADMHTPGMSAATPILLARQGVSMKEAAEAAALVHNAIIKLED